MSAVKGGLVFLVVLSVVALAQAQDACRGSVGGKNYNLTTLAFAVGRGGQVQTQDGNGQVYTYKVCGSLGGLCLTAIDSTPAICQIDNNQNQHDCGSASRVSWAPNPSGSDGFTLRFSGGTDGRNSKIVFTCDPYAGIGTFTFDSESPAMTYNFRWASKYACPVAVIHA